MADLYAKHSGLLAHQVVGEERLPFLPSLLGNSRQQLITVLTIGCYPLLR